jgi:acetyl esterase/lipase
MKSTLSHVSPLLLAITVAVILNQPVAAQNRPGGLPPLARVPQGVKSHRDLAYVVDGHERQKLDLFLPDAEGSLPLIIWIHGGGWQNGSKDGCPPLRNGYTERGYAVASINYRLSGHAVFPAQIEDCKAAIRWLRAHAGEYGLDSQRFGVWGSSAGGHLVALVGTSGDVQAFDVGAHLDQSSRVQAVCDYYGPTDFTAFVTTPGYESHATANSPEAKLIGGAVMQNRDKAARANPITYVSEDDPAFLIVHGDKDPTVPINQSQLLYDALQQAGVSVHFHTIRGAGHGQGFGGPEIEPMVGNFFDRVLKAEPFPSNLGPAKTSDSIASPASGGIAGRTGSPGGVGNMGWEQVRRIERVEDDARVSRNQFRGPASMFDRLDRNRDGFVSKEDFSADGSTTAATDAAVPTGLLYFASYRERDNPAAVTNPHLVGALFTLYWSDIEKREGEFDWTDLDRRIGRWTSAGRKVALRIMWSSSGNWPEPAAKTPTPQFVLDAGAVTVRSESSKTDVPLFWDPIYRKHANLFLAEVARKFDGDPNVLFLDVTPGAETNPYRFRRINAAEPGFKTSFSEKPASDGRRYSHELWLETVKQAIDEASATFKKTPLLVTLNVGSLDGPEQFLTIGSHAVSRGCYVGQNGLNARSYNEDSPRKTAFTEWSARTKFYFEMVDASGNGTGSLMDVMQAAKRVGCSYLGVYAVDVLRGTKGQPDYDPQVEAALAWGAKALGSEPTAKVPGTASAENPAGTAGEFQLNGDRWTYRDGDFAMSGILLKPEGRGPFPAVLISHGLGGSAESFGLNKAREMVKWGFVCIAPSYTHSAGALGNRSGASKAGPPTNGARGGQRPVDYGASAENLRRASTCLELVSRMPEVDAKRLFAYGHSMGGFVTIGLAATAPDRLQAAAITGSGIGPREGFPAPSAAKAEQVRSPFLILHGSADTTVRPQQSADFKAILDKNRVLNDRTVYDGEGHPIDQTQREQVFAAVRAWFEKHGGEQP